MLVNSWLRVLYFPTLCLLFANGIALGSTSPVDFKLNGILISTSERSALINGKIVSEGERVAGVEIVSIEEAAVRVLSGSQEYTVPVGSVARLEPSANRPIRPRRIDPGSSSTTRQVNRGETLSGIAQQYVRQETNLNQIMVALFEANPHAFGGNMNELYAGAELRIPDYGDMQSIGERRATVEVANHAKSWRIERVRTAKAIESSEAADIDINTVNAALLPPEYGPVRYGETLSEIAQDISGSNIPMREMMAALFQANPHAFGEDVDVLFEGVVLRIPSFAEIDESPAMAASNY